MIPPRPRTLLAALALCAGAVAGESLFRFLSVQQLAQLSGWGAPAVFGGIVAIWAARRHALEAIKTLPALVTSEARAALALQGEVSIKSFQLIVCVIVCAALGGLPWAAYQVTRTVWEWMVVTAGVGAIAAMVSLYIAFYWVELVDHTVNLMKAEAERARRQAELIKQMGALPPDTDATSEWAKEPPKRLVANG